MSLLQEIVVFLCGFILSWRLVAAQVFLPGGCPNVEVVTDFRPSEYLGKWYEAERYFFIFELGGKCVTATYTDLGNGTVGVYNSNYNTITGKQSGINGTATLSDPSVAKLAVRFPSVPGNFAAPYWVVDTDYTSYALVWSCNDFRILHTVTSWILTREQRPSSDVLNKAYAAATKNNISRKFFMKTNQDDCAAATTSNNVI
ncbi:unnamed protein product [Diatraea saccharalis]|uniref:Apolipoprotein D n=1 Tax=Diatraea saccharalis TaxID=40085 RepID=A0A9N9RI18_9NEOP|nr:unnamed protein product [Diatraea saccharalis]